MANKKFVNLAVIPSDCKLWNQEKPDPNLENIKKYVDESSFRRILKKCIECGQLYFYEMLEFIDWEDGEDPMYRTYVPVATEADADTLAAVTQVELCSHVPQIRYDWPKGVAKSKILWIKE